MNKMEITFNSTLEKHLEGQNIAKLSRELRIPKSLLHDWIKGKRLPSLKNLDHIKSLADYLGLTLDELLLGSKEVNSLISSISFTDEKRKYKIDIRRIK